MGRALLWEALKALRGRSFRQVWLQSVEIAGSLEAGKRWVWLNSRLVRIAGFSAVTMW